jgi:hypothetical protein
MSTTGKPSKGVTHPSELAFTAQEIVLLAEKAPAVYRELMDEKKLDQKHRRRFAWATLIAQQVGNFCGLIALLLLAGVAWHALDLGDSTQGAAIICTGAVSIVAVFVTGRLTNSSVKRQRKQSPH